MVAGYKYTDNYIDYIEIPDCSGVGRERLLFWDIIPAVRLVEDEESFEELFWAIRS